MVTKMILKGRIKRICALKPPFGVYCADGGAVCTSTPYIILSIKCYVPHIHTFQ